MEVESISMDFITGLPKTQKGHDAIWVVVDRLTKSAHVLPFKSKTTLEQMAQLYIEKVVSLHGIPTSIISNRDSRFTSGFWMGLQKAMGTSLDFSTAFYPQIDGQTERVNQVFEDML